MTKTSYIVFSIEVYFIVFSGHTYIGINEKKRFNKKDRFRKRKI